MKTCRVDELFTVRYGVNLELNALEQSTNGINFVARTAKNNGVSAKVLPLPWVVPIPAGTISVACGGSVMESFLQPAPYYSGRDLFYLTAKVPMTDAVKLYYCLCLRANKFKYSYGRQANETLASLQIPALDELPEEIKGFSLEAYAEEMRSAIDTGALDVKSGNIHEEGSIQLGQLFKVVNGIVSSDVERLPYRKSSNWVPYIRPSYRQSTSIDAYVNRHSVPQDKVFPKGTLYVSTNGQGSHTYAYVSATDFVPNSDVSVLLPLREMCLREKLAYALFITANRFRFSYGRKPKGDKLKSIILPASIPEEWNNCPLTNMFFA